VASECIAVGTSRGWYYPNDAKHAYVTAYDDDATYSASNREKAWKTIRSYPWVIGAFQWHAYEYRGESVNWPRLCSISGVIDLFWQKKDAFYQNVSFFTQKPMVHLLPHWNFEGREGEPIRVVAYTNCEEVELYLDGNSLGICKVEQYGHAEWNVPFKAGKLQAVARNNGEDVAVSIRETTKKGVRLSLKLMNVEPLHANGKDLALVSCSVLDEDGREVPTATPYLRFTTNRNGYIYSTGSDNTDHNSIYIPDRKMYAGKATAAVKVGKETGPLRVYVESDGLISASLEINLL
jgi:beta-galactosidase